MIIADTLSRLGDAYLCTMLFAKAVQAYFKDRTLPKDNDLKQELQEHLP